MVIRYWSAERSSAEIDFLVQYSGKVIPVEVKASHTITFVEDNAASNPASPNITAKYHPYRNHY